MLVAIDYEKGELINKAVRSGSRKLMEEVLRVLSEGLNSVLCSAEKFPEGWRTCM